MNQNNAFCIVLDTISKFQNSEITFFGFFTLQNLSVSSRDHSDRLIDLVYNRLDRNLRNSKVIFPILLTLAKTLSLGGKAGGRSGTLVHLIIGVFKQSTCERIKSLSLLTIGYLAENSSVHDELTDIVCDNIINIQTESVYRLSLFVLGILLQRYDFNLNVKSLLDSINSILKRLHGHNQSIIPPARLDFLHSVLGKDCNVAPINILECFCIFSSLKHGNRTVYKF